MGIGKKIGELCKLRGISLRRLASDAGIPYTTVYSSVKRDSDSIDSETIRKIAKALNVDPVEIVLTDLSEESVNRAVLVIKEENSRKKLEMFISAVNYAGFTVVFGDESEGITIKRKGTDEVIAQNVSVVSLVNAVSALIDYAGYLCTKMTDWNITKD